MVLTNIERNYIKNTLLLYELYLATKKASGFPKRVPEGIDSFISEEDDILKTDLSILWNESVEKDAQKDS